MTITPTAVEAERLYTVQEAANRLALSSGRWLYKQIKEGNLEYVDLNPGGEREKIRIRATTLNHLVETFTRNKGARP